MLDGGNATWHGVVHQSQEAPPGAKELCKKGVLCVMSLLESAITTMLLTVSLNTPCKAQTSMKNVCHLQCSLSPVRIVSYFESNLMHTPPLPLYLEGHHKEKGSCKAEARCPQFLPPHSNHAAPPGLPEQLELGIKKASLSKVFSLCCRAFPLHPYSSSW